MSDRLSVYEGRGGYRWLICWICDGDQGSTVGEVADAATCEPGSEGYEAYVVQETVKNSPGCKRDKRSLDGFCFESRAQAVAAKRAADFARKNIEIPMPQWAIQAAAAGWKAPKGWKP